MRWVSIWLLWMTLLPLLAPPALAKAPTRQQDASTAREGSAESPPLALVPLASPETSAPDDQRTRLRHRLFLGLGSSLLFVGLPLVAGGATLFGLNGAPAGPCTLPPSYVGGDSFPSCSFRVGLVMTIPLLLGGAAAISAGGALLVPAMRGS